MSKQQPKQAENSLSVSVENCLQHYLKQLDGDEPADLYRLVINEAECALIKTVLNYAGNNQSKAADYLGITRGTLRKKIRQYQLIEK